MKRNVGVLHKTRETHPRVSRMGLIFYEQNCKPGSVFDSHLSRRTVAGTLKPPPEDGRASLVCPPTVLLRIEFTATDSSQPSGALLPHLSTLTGTARLWRRYISVALFLKSPSAGVTRYPCPVEPGLSSWTAFRPAHATVCFTRPFILQERRGIVNG